MGVIRTGLLVASVALFLSEPAHAFRGRDPASLLVFPLFDSRGGSVTLLSVTNTNDDRSFDSRTGLSRGTIDLEYVYIDSATCQEFNRMERLTPNDTFTCMTSSHHPEGVLGFCWVVARDPMTGRTIDFDHLIGQAVCLDAVDALEISYNAVGYEAMSGSSNPTDLDNDNRLDLNGLEYEGTPDRIYIPRFYGQNGPVDIDTDLVLVNLSGGTSFTATMDLLIVNDNEQVFSSEYTFSCWSMVPLNSISGAFNHSFLVNTDHDPEEILGFPEMEAGWFEISGAVANSPAKTVQDPSVLVVMVERMGSFGSADLPYESPERRFNGTILARGVEGDNED